MCYRNRFWIRCFWTKTTRGGGGGEGEERLYPPASPPERGPSSRLEYDEEQRGIREAFIDDGDGDGVGDNDNGKVWMVKKGKVSSGLGVVDDEKNAETMISIEMEDIEQAKVEREGEREGGEKRLFGGGS